MFNHRSLILIVVILLYVCHFVEQRPRSDDEDDDDENDNHELTDDYGHSIGKIPISLGKKVEHNEDQEQDKQNNDDDQDENDNQDDDSQGIEHDNSSDDNTDDYGFDFVDDLLNNDETTTETMTDKPRHPIKKKKKIVIIKKETTSKLKDDSTPVVPNYVKIHQNNLNFDQSGHPTVSISNSDEKLPQIFNGHNEISPPSAAQSETDRSLIIKVYRGPTKLVERKPFASWGYFVKFPNV